MAEALLIAAAEGILRKALSIAANEVAIALGYKNKLTELHDTLKMIRAKLSDAEEKRSTGVVMEWLKQLKSIVNEADDVLDDVHYEMLRREVKKRDQARKILSFPSLENFLFGREMGHKIENINKEFSRIYELAKNIQLQDDKVEPAENSRPSGTVPYLDEFKIVGRESDELRIVEVDTLLADIYESLAGEKVKSLTRVNLIRNLQDKLGSKRYLLVLDDVWDEELAYWDEFRRCTLQVKSDDGSGIIVTTRKLNIGRNATIEDSYALERLSYDDSWAMFRERALPLPEFERIGHEIVKRCGGLPLLVDILGSMLRHYSTDKSKWLSIQESKVWDEEERGRVLSILKLSFDNLPNSMVKQCFLYCSIYEKDKFITREEVVRLWMALGLLQTNTTRNKEMEEVGNDIFQILVNNSLLQNVTRDQFGDMTSCQMHDLVHDLLLYLSRHETLSLVATTSDDVHIPPVKHLALYQKDYKDTFPFKFENDVTSRTLHTLFFAGGFKENMSLQYFKCLRILKLSSSSLSEIPESIGELMHLRYLDFSDTDIRILPKSIGNLYHLQTLKLLSCSSIEFPQEMNNLISLRHLVIESYLLPPKDVGLLTSLRTLAYFQVGRQKGRQIEELIRPFETPWSRGTLRICNLEEIGSKEEAVKANLTGKPNLNTINYLWSSCFEGGNRNDKDVLKGLQAAANVKMIKIEKFSGDSFPEWAMKMKLKTERNWVPLAKLVKITLSNCCNCVNIPMLEDLPLLQDLVLRKIAKVTCLSSSLDQRKPLSPSLRSLTLGDMDLTVLHCNKLTCLPGGFDSIALLNKLEIGAFSKEPDSFPSLSGIEKLGNHLHSLYLRGWEHWESIPEDIKHLNGLTSLYINRFGVRELPVWLINMSSIRQIVLYYK